MPVWWTILAYTVAMSFFGTLIYNSSKKTSPEAGIDSLHAENQRKISLFFAFVSFALLVFFVGQRSYIFDTYQYQYAYDNYYTGDLSQIKDLFSAENTDKGKGYTFLLILFKHFLHGTANDWFTFLAIFQIIPVVLFFYKYSVNFTLSSYFFITSGCVLWLVNGVRQFLAVTLILYFVDWIFKKKTFPFIIVVLIAATVHNTAVLWLPVYFLIHLKTWSKKFVISSFILTVCAFFLINSSLFNDTNYSYIGTSGGSGVNPLRVLFMSIPTCLAFYFRNDIKSKTNRNADICVNISVICTEMYIVGMFTNGVVGRLPIYFELFNYILLPWMLENAVNEVTKKTIKLCLIVLFMLFFSYNMIIAGNGVYNSSSLNLFFT